MLFNSSKVINVLLPQYNSKQGIPKKPESDHNLFIKCINSKPTENNSGAGRRFKFLPDYQGETVQHRPGTVQVGGEGKWDLGSQQSALLRIPWNWSLRHWNWDTLFPVNSRESSSERLLNPLSVWNILWKIAPLAYRRRLRYLDSWFWCLKVGRIMMNLCALLHLYFRFFWYLLRKSV